MEGRFLEGTDWGALRASCQRAQQEGAGAVFLSDGPLGDATVLAAGLSGVSDLQLGVVMNLGRMPHRHPTVMAREMTTLDLLCNGRSILALGPPLNERVIETARLCLSMWRNGIAVNDGSTYPVPGAVNVPGPATADTPRIALDLRDGSQSPAELLEMVDYLLMATDDPGVCQMHSVRA